MAEVNMEGMRVAIVDHVGLKAGMEVYDFGLFQGLHQAGCKAILISNFQVPQQEKNIIPLFKFSFDSGALSYSRLLLHYFKARRIIRDRKVNYCILHGFRFGFAEWLLIRVISRRSLKILLLIHDLDSLIGKSPRIGFRERIFSLCEKLIVQNQFSNASLRKEVSKSNADKIVVIPHGNYLPAAELFPEEGAIVSPAQNELLFFGQIKPTKGLDLLLESLPLTDPEIKLTIAGRMRLPSFSAYQETIRRLGIEKRVQLKVEHIPAAQRSSLLNSATAIVLPYTKVYQSGVLLLAMSLGKVVIASDLPPNKEVIIDGENGFLFEAGSKTSLAQTITRVMKDEGLRIRTGKRALEFVRENHNWLKIAEQWKNLMVQ